MRVERVIDVTWTVRIKLAELLRELGVSQRQLSRATGIRQAFISSACLGELKHMPLDNLARICQALNCDMWDVMEMEKGE